MTSSGRGPYLGVEKRWSDRPIVFLKRVFSEPSERVLKSIGGGILEAGRICGFPEIPILFFSFPEYAFPGRVVIKTRGFSGGSTTKKKNAVRRERRGSANSARAPLQGGESHGDSKNASARGSGEGATSRLH